MLIRGDEPIIIIRRSENGIDAYGNATYATEEILIRDGLFAYLGSSEAEDINRNPLDAKLTLYLPPGSDVRDGDLFEIRETLWEKDGQVQQYPNAVGFETGVVVPVRRRVG